MKIKNFKQFYRDSVKNNRGWRDAAKASIVGTTLAVAGKTQGLLPMEKIGAVGMVAGAVIAGTKMVHDTIRDARAKKPKSDLKEAKESKIVSAFHYSDAKFNSFDPSYLEGGTDQKGPGLYASNEHESHYGKNMHHLKIDTSKFIRPGQKVNKKIIKDMVENSPHLHDVTPDWDEDHETGKHMLIKSCSNAPDMHEAMERVWHDAYKSNNQAFLENAGMHYHGTIVKPNKFRPSSTHYVIWNGRSIKSISHDDYGDHDENI